MMNCKWCGKKRSWPNLSYSPAAAQPAQGSSEPVAPRMYLFIYFLSRHLPGEIEENHKTLSQDSGFQAEIWKRDHPNTKQVC
jgi:hypothetical protein